MASRFLVRGVIYEMRAFQRAGQCIPSSQSGVSEDLKRDWSSFLHTHVNPSTAVSTAASVDASDVMERLGIKDVIPGVEDRILMQKNNKPKDKEKQALEEIIGIRAKYAQKLREKKRMADFKREQGKFVSPDEPVYPPKSTDSLVPGSSALVRYLQERGILQGLVTQGCKEEDLRSFLEDLGNFKFQEIIKERLSDVLLSSICSKWGLPSTQLMVVVSGESSDDVINAIANGGYFICRAGSESHKEEKAVETTVEEQTRSGFIGWLKKKLKREEEYSQEQTQTNHITPHFTVTDMTELKWIIEDLNGVSYKSSSLLGFK